MTHKLNTILLIITASAIFHSMAIGTKDIIHFDNDFNDDQPELDPISANIRAQDYGGYSWADISLLNIVQFLIKQYIIE